MTAMNDADRGLARRIQIALYLILGVGDLWLWYVGHANMVAAILGVGFTLAGLVLAWRAYARRGGR